ncbi:MAG TPA: hypothetical protein VD907_00725 [Verrucomicrobiae bacterium]|nr:hypothetical protein [Verrucomicrobiae bacterium]
MKQGMTAVAFRRVLLGSLLLLILLAALGYYLLGTMLTEAARDSMQKKIDATVGRSDLEQLQRMETYLRDHQDIVKRASEIVAESKEYQYQNQIIDDINTFARRSGVTVTGFSFDTNTAPTTGSGQAAPRVAPGGLKIVPVTITLQNPLPYTNFLRFLKSIEQNLTKMQVTGVSLSPDTENAARITNPTIGLEVYVR